MTSAITIDDAAIKAWPSGQIELLPAQGTGSLIVPYMLILSLSNWVADYTNINAAAKIQVFNGSTFDPLINLANNATDFGVGNLLANGGSSLNIMTSKQVIASGNLGMLSGLALAGQLNQPLVAHFNNFANGNLTGGNPATTLKITTIYQVIDLT